MPFIETGTNRLSWPVLVTQAPAHNPCWSSDSPWYIVTIAHQSHFSLKPGGWSKCYFYRFPSLAHSPLLFACCATLPTSSIRFPYLPFFLLYFLGKTGKRGGDDGKGFDGRDWMRLTDTKGHFCFYYFVAYTNEARASHWDRIVFCLALLNDIYKSATMWLYFQWHLI